MPKTKKSILSLIPEFLRFCQKRGFSLHTQNNYKRYLKRFVLWLKENKKENLKPSQLSLKDISKYKDFLAQYKDEKGHCLQKSTQNYYLIALRALLSYFCAKNIECIVPEKIKLLKGIDSQKFTPKFNLEEIKRILFAPDIAYEQGLRDRAILETILFNGFKVSRLVALDRKDIGDLSDRSRIWVERYLKSRQDNFKAMFIHYRSKKGIENRLSVRSVQRIVKKYAKKAGLPYSVTPEVLRQNYIYYKADLRKTQKEINSKNQKSIRVKKQYENPTSISR